MRKTIARLLTQLAEWIHKPQQQRSQKERKYKTLCPQPRNRRPYATRIQHAPVDLVEAQRLYQNGATINDIVIAVKGTRAAFDVKKLVRKTFKSAGILKRQDEALNPKRA
jgi:hypothetical protein